MRSVRATVVVFALVLGLSGCLSAPGPTFAPVDLVGGAFKMDLPIHVVAVGFDDFDGDLLLSKLRQPVAPYKLIRWDATGDTRPEPLQYNLQYMVHEAPEEFATGLFDFAKSTATRGAPDAFLAIYDRAGPQRACPRGDGLAVLTLTLVAPPPCQDVDQLDAAKIEAWIAENRARYGLDFGAPGHTVFILDSYTKGYLPKDTYHVYAIDDGTTDPAVKNQRGWGGTYDFVFYDVGAAPNRADYNTWANYTRDGNPLEGKVDRPIWDFDLSKTVPPGKGTSPVLLGSDELDKSTFYANMAQNVYDSARFLWARSPIYPFEYFETYRLPMYIFIDPNAHTNPDSPLYRFKASDVETNTDVEGIRRAFQELVPWAEVDLSVEFVYLPEDDPALNAALEDAKSRYSANYVDFGILKKYFRDNWERYVPSLPGARSYPTFAFWLEAPSTGLYAYSDGDELGNSWGVFYNVADTLLCLAPTRPVCFVEEAFPDEKSWWALWNAILVHELGHSFGLTHPHDGGSYDEERYSTYELNWLWDSTSSVMTYRHSLYRFNQFDKDLIFRGNAADIAMQFVEAGRRDVADRILDRIRAGSYEEAFGLARDEALNAGLAEPREELGIPGAVTRERVTLPASEAPVGSPPLVPWPAYVPATDGATYVDVAIPAPDDARAVQIEYREADAASHARWAAGVEIIDAQGDYITGLWNNGYDKVVYLNLERCKGACVARIYSWSGVGTTYDVSVTPYT